MNKELFTTLMQSLIGFLVSILIAFIAWQTTKWSSSIEEMSKSVSQLNTKLEVVMTQFSDNNEYVHKTLTDHEHRIRGLESRKR